MMSLCQFLGKTKTSRMSLRLLALSFLFPAIAFAQVAITTTALPGGNTSNLYTATLAASGGTAPFTWQLTGGVLPAGLTLSSAGVISGKATDLTTGNPPVASSFTVQVSDSTSLTATQTFSISILPPGSHSLVINQFFSGGNGSTSSPYAYNYAELFNASPAVIDLQNWTIQISPATSAFSQTGVYPIGSLDPYSVGTIGGSDGKGNYPAFQITYSAAFTAKNCNPVATSTQLNSAFPALHCWLNPGQYLLVLLGTTSSTGALKTQPEIAPDLDLTDGFINGTANSLDTGAVLGNVGSVAATSSAPTVWVGHNITSSNANSNLAKVNPSDGMFAVVNGVGVEPACSTGTIANPKPAASFSPKVSDFIGYIAQLSAGGEAPPICWEGANAAGYATHVSSSGKNTNSLIRSAGNGKLNTAVTGAAAPAGTILPTTGVTLTPCGDTDNNLSDFAPIANGLKGQINWVLHNSQQVLTKATTTTLNAPADYTPAACPSLNATGPAVTATFSSPNVGQGAGGGSITETLTITATPSSAPTSTLFKVNVDLSGVPGASSAAPLTSSSIGIPDGLGNVSFQEQITLPTTTSGTFNFPVTVLDDAYRGGSNANNATPLIASVMIGSACQQPVASAQTVQLGWNAPKAITLNAQVGQNCSTNDTLTYAVQTQPASGTLSLASGNSITYTPNASFSGLDSFTFNVTDTTNPAGPLTGATVTVSLVVSATGVTPTLTLTCPTAAYDLNAQSFCRRYNHHQL
jgi:large repetitive protein